MGFIPFLTPMPEPDFILAGIFEGGIAGSRDGGVTWERCDNGLTHNDVYSLATTHLGQRLRLFAGTEPAHFYVSDDLGLNWREMPALRSVPSTSRWTFPAPPHIGHVKYISIAPDDPATVYACIEQGGMLKSTDAGETWHELAGFDDDVHRMLIHPHNPKQMHLMSGIGLYVSEDGGSSWERRTDHQSPMGGYPDQLAFVPSRPDVMIASGAKDDPGIWVTTGFAGSRITRSRDGGRTWEILRNGLPSPERCRWRSKRCAWRNGDSRARSSRRPRRARFTPATTAATAGRLSQSGLPLYPRARTTVCWREPPSGRTPPARRADLAPILTGYRLATQIDQTLLAKGGVAVSVYRPS